MEQYTVYVKADARGRIVAVASSAFLKDAAGWQAVDRGYGDKFRHAQSNYLPLSVIREDGIFRYKLEDGKILQRSEEEMAGDVIIPQETDKVTWDALASAIAEGVNAV